jgi:transcriptional antiterminator RfaH
MTGASRNDMSLSDAQPTTSGGVRWYLIQSKPRQTQRAEENLARQGYCTYLPVIGVERLIRGRRTRVEAPLFPNYLFIRLNHWNDNWYPIRSTRGVAKLVSFGDEPLPVADRLIAEIARRIAAREVEPAFRPGEPVKMIDGPLRGLDAIFAAQRDDERVVLLIDLLQRQLRVTVPAGSVRRDA